MIKFYSFILAFLMLDFYGIACSAPKKDSNLITLRVIDNKVTYINSVTSDGTTSSSKEELVFDFSKLSIIIEGILSPKDSVTVKIYERQFGVNATVGGHIIQFNISNSEKLLLNSKFNEINPGRKKNGLVLVFSNSSNAINIPIKAAAGSDFELEESKAIICSDPIFYRSAQLGVVNEIKDSKPFYLIEYDFNMLQTGPNITLYKTKKKDDGTFKLEPNPKYTVHAGRNATVVFNNFKPYYDKITLTTTFVDFHLEDQSTFKELIAGNKTPATSGAVPAGGAGEKKLTSGEKQNNQAAITNTLRILGDELGVFWSDIQKRRPRTEKVVAVLSQVKVSIKSCLGGPDIITPSSLETYINTTYGPVNNNVLNRVIRALQQIEDYSLYALNTFQVKNMDEMRLNVSYTKDNQAVDVNPDPFVIPVLCGLKLDFSTGFLFSNLSDRKYIITDAPSITKQESQPDGTVTEETVDMKRIVEETDGKFKIGFGILSHFYPRLSKWVSIGLTSGFIVKDNLVVQFPLGGSVMIGRESRIALSAGKVFGEVSRLSDRYTEGKEVEATTLNNVTNDSLTTKKFRSGWFFAFTYNFGGTTIGH